MKKIKDVKNLDYHISKIIDMTGSNGNSDHGNSKLSHAYTALKELEITNDKILYDSLIEELYEYTKDEFKDFDFKISIEFAKIVYSIIYLIEVEKSIL